eukprot:CAMPEP_0114696476 /NCGR_PEP_ID=MMETSP0191-20121206/72615_1 /TAXON_ID=126664 /ORGANISM="Sorites sp." /LENGTH=307 /DNA_ID=CAMNT_0001994195 /DNA_START=25 /DNA_END=944 /DNA_ORIENTATION=+
MARTLCVLLHANGLCKDVWTPFAQSLARLLRVDLHPEKHRRPEVLSWRLGGIQLVSMDLRGHGQASTMQVENSHIEAEDWMAYVHQLEEMLEEFVQEMPVQEIVGIGHSLGGGALLLSQALGQRRFSKMFIFEPMYLFVEEKVSKMVGVDFKHLRLNPLVAKTLRRKSVWATRDEACKDLSQKQFFAAWDSGALQAYFQGGLIGDAPTRLACNPQTEAAVFCSGVPATLLETLRKPDGLQHCSLNVTIGQRDTLWNMPVAEEIFGRLEPSAKLSVVDGSHMWPVESPAACAATVADSFGWCAPSGSR